MAADRENYGKIIKKVIYEVSVRTEMSTERAKRKNLSLVNPLSYCRMRRANKRARKRYGEALGEGEEMRVRELSVEIPVLEL